MIKNIKKIIINEKFPANDVKLLRTFEKIESRFSEPNKFSVGIKLPTGDFKNI